MKDASLIALAAVGSTAAAQDLKIHVQPVAFEMWEIAAEYRGVEPTPLQMA